jgi:hypothetical protein
MKRSTCLALGLVALAITRPALGDEQQKAEKQFHKITAMATDGTGRRVVSITVTDALGAKRADLVNERREMNLNYGDLYIAHQLVKNGAKMDDIAAQLKAGKNIGQIANDQHLDWKQVAVDAKKLNTTMEDNLYKNFLNGKPYADRDKADGYDLVIDGVAADNSVSKEEIADAEHTYQTWRDRAEKAKGSNLDTSAENAAQGARGDPVRSKAGTLSAPKQ